MPTLDKETFSYWVTHPNDLSATDLVQLQKSLSEYPYCQTIHTLTAKAASIHQRGHAISYIRQAAAHALSRNALRKLIENEFYWSDNLLTKLNELAAKHVPIPEDYQQESYALFKARSGATDGFPKLSLLQLPVTNEINWDQTRPLPEDQTLAETNLQQDLAQIEESALDASKLSAADLERKRQFDLIESFIKNEPSISRITPPPTKAKSADSGDQEDLTKRSKIPSGTLVTESFAKILEKQGKIDKARDIYKKLMAKNPEKKAYFAAKISELANRSNTAEE
ncbi:hypothetical protein GCM10028805_01140 [Spirosoma harenae]